MKVRTTMGLIAFGTVLLAAAIGVAAARSHAPRNEPRPPVRVSALERRVHLSRSERRELGRLHLHVARSARASIAATADVPSARPVDLPDGLGRAWVSPAADGAICTFIPDPLGGYGSSCASQDDLRTGGAVTVLGGAGPLNNEAVAVMIVPDGGQAPVVTEPDGSQVTQSVDGLGATVVPEKSVVTIGAVNLEVPTFDPRCGAGPARESRQCGL
jgi:hypothetical protein